MYKEARTFEYGEACVMKENGRYVVHFRGTTRTGLVSNAAHNYKRSYAETSCEAWRDAERFSDWHKGCGGRNKAYEEPATWGLVNMDGTVERVTGEY